MFELKNWMTLLICLSKTWFRMYCYLNSLVSSFSRNIFTTNMLWYLYISEFPVLITSINSWYGSQSLLRSAFSSSILCSKMHWRSLPGFELLSIWFSMLMMRSISFLRIGRLSLWLTVRLGLKTSSLLSNIYLMYLSRYLADPFSFLINRYATYEWRRTGKNLLES